MACTVDSLFFEANDFRGLKKNCIFWNISFIAFPKFAFKNYISYTPFKNLWFKNPQNAQYIFVANNFSVFYTTKKYNVNNMQTYN